MRIITLLKTIAKRLLEPFLFATTLALILPFGVPWSRLRLARLRRLGLRPRTVFGPLPIINAITLAESLRRAGYEAESVCYKPYYITARFDHRFDRWHDTPGLRHLLPYAVFIWAYFRFDLFHAYYDGGFLMGTPFRYLELPLLALGGKRSVIIPYGADARTRNACRAYGPYNACLFCEEPGRHCICDDRRGRANYRHHRRWASACLSCGDMIEYTPGSDNSRYPLPIDVSAIEPAYGGLDDGIIRVVHASNHRNLKGTPILERAVAQLKSEGLPIELILVERIPNAEAQKLYRKADIIFDQCYAGCQGYFAIEALALGKPTLTFIRKREYLPLGIEPPFVNINPETLTDRLRELVLDRERRLVIGRYGRSYCERVFSYEAVAGRYIHLYRRLFPWLVGPLLRKDEEKCSVS